MSETEPVVIVSVLEVQMRFDLCKMIDQVVGWSDCRERALQYLVQQMAYLLEFCWDEELSLDKLKKRCLSEYQREMEQRVPGIEVSRRELGEILELSDQQLPLPFEQIKEEVG